MDSQDLDTIKSLSPFNSMSNGDFDLVKDKLSIGEFTEGKMIFKREEEDSNACGLLSGSIDLLDEKFEAKNRKAGDEPPLHIDNNNPHRMTAITTEASKVLTGPELVGGTTSATTAEPDEESVDWMSALLNSPLFEFIPPTNIQTLFSKFEKQKYDAGDVVSQGNQVITSMSFKREPGK